MAFTGRFGTTDSQLGNIVLGSVGAQGGGGTVNGSFSADAIVLATTSASFSADAVVRATISGSFSGDAVLAATGSGSFTADAVLYATVLGSFSADAIVRATIGASFSADAAISTTNTGLFTADAILGASVSDGFTADAVLLATLAASFSADAVIKATATGSLTADAIIVGGGAATFSADAIVLATLTVSFSADAIILTSSSASLTADAMVATTTAAAFSADAVIRATQTATFSADAVLLATVAGSFSADAELSYPFFWADAYIAAAPSATSFTADAFIHVIVWSDDFNRADETPIGDPYFEPTPSFDDLRLSSNTLVVDPGDFGKIRGYRQFDVVGQIQFDFYTGATLDNFAYAEVDALGGEVGATTHWPWLVVQNDGENGANQTWSIYSSSLDISPVTLLPDTWYTVKLGITETEEHIKYWVAGTAEPSWIASSPLETGNVANINNAALYLGGRSTGTFPIDNLLLTSLTTGRLVVVGSFTANAIIKTTVEWSGAGTAQPTIVGHGSGTSASSSLQISRPSGAQFGDTVIWIGAFNGQIAEGSTGGVRPVLSDVSTYLTRVAHTTPPSGTTGGSITVWSGIVAPDSAGSLPSSYVWEYSFATTTRRAAVLVVVRDKRPETTRVSTYYDGTTQNLQTIPAGTHTFVRDLSLALIAYAGNQTNLSSFLAPTNATELRDVISGLASGAHVVLEVSSAPVSAGASPSFSADSQGANAVTQSLIIEITPKSGLTADAVIEAGEYGFSADAFIAIETRLIFEDSFDRFTSNGWGNNWAVVPFGTGVDQQQYFSVDGAVGKATNAPFSTQPRFVGYPLITFGQMDFDMLFGSVDDEIYVGMLGGSHYSEMSLINDTLWLNGGSTSFAITPNQWYSVRLEYLVTTVKATVWLRGSSMPSPQLVETTLTGTIAQWAFVSGSASLQVDNIKIYSGGTWQVHGAFSANAVVKKTITQRDNGFGALIPATIYCEAELGRGFDADAYIWTGVVHTFSADAEIVTHHTFDADAVIEVPTRTTHERDGHLHTGVDYETAHVLAATIGTHLQGTSLRDVLIDIDARLTELEAQ